MHTNDHRANAKQGRLNRRRFLTAAASGAAGLLAAPAIVRGRGLNDKLNIAIIGCGGRGASNLQSVAAESIVAFIPKSMGHHAEWLHACKTGAPTTCNFKYSGWLTEANHLGNVAYRVGKKLEWDAEQLKATGAPEADALIRREYRKGWTLG